MGAGNVTNTVGPKSTNIETVNKESPREIPMGLTPINESNGNAQNQVMNHEEKKIKKDKVSKKLKN